MITIQVFQTVEDSCKKSIKKYANTLNFGVKICEFFLMFKNIFENDLLNVLMVKLQTVDIYLGYTRLSFFSWHEICPEIRQMHTMSYKTAMENVNILSFTLFQSK